MTVLRLPVPLRPALSQAGDACLSGSAASVITEKHNDASDDSLRCTSVAALDGRSANAEATDVDSVIARVDSEKFRSSTAEASSEAIARSVNILYAGDSRSMRERSTRRNAKALALQERKRQRSLASLSDNATETAAALHVPRHHEAGCRAGATGATEAHARHSTCPGGGGDRRPNAPRRGEAASPRGSRLPTAGRTLIPLLLAETSLLVTTRSRRRPSAAEPPRPDAPAPAPCRSPQPCPPSCPRGEGPPREGGEAGGPPGQLSRGGGTAHSPFFPPPGGLLDDQEGPAEGA